MLTPLPGTTVPTDTVKVGFTGWYDGDGVDAEATAGARLNMAKASTVAPAKRRRSIGEPPTAFTVM
jgi:hypothetical protein